MPWPGASWFDWTDVRTPPGESPITYEEFSSGVESGKHFETWYEYEHRSSGAIVSEGMPTAVIERYSWDASFSRDVPQQTWEQAFGSAGHAPILGEGTLP